MGKMRKIFIIFLLVFLTTSCAVSQANQPLPAGNYSLVYVEPPHAYGDIDRKALREAIMTNLSFLQRIDPETEFDYGGKIVRAREVANTQRTLLQIIDTAESNEMIELLMDYMFEWYKASGIDGKGNVIFTGYYVPEVEGSLYPSDKYRYPLYRPPDDLKKDTTFFKLDNAGAKGSIHVLLTPGHSIATDPSLFPRGGLSFIKTTTPVVDQTGKVLKWEQVNRFVLNQDEGGAIKGPGRVDLFWGAGFDAGLSAGSMKERGELYFILQK